MSADVHWFLPIVSAGGYQEHWPYGPSTNGFHPDLAIQFDADYRATKPALAVVSGTVYVLPDSNQTTCGAFLMPDPDVNKLLSDGIGELAFHLRTLDLADLVARWKDRITAKLPKGVTAGKQLENFQKGWIPLPVKSGDELALLAPVGGGSSNGLAQFEAIFAPRRGSYIGKGRALDYAQRLVDPAHRARRIDPMSFYYRVKGGAASGVAIAAEHADHPLWTIPTLRCLIELREERDRTFSTTIEVETSTGTTPVQLSDADWAHYVAVPNGTAGTPVDLKVRKQNWRLTRLPTAPVSLTEAPVIAALPWHVALQSIYMTATASSDSWFSPNTVPLSFFTEQNAVKPLIDGIDAFAAMVSFLKRIQQPEQFFWLAGWWCNDRFDMIEGDDSTTLLKLATDADKGNADVRVILWSQHLEGHWANKKTVDDINALPGHNGVAILDSQTKSSVGSHHQKFMVAYLGPDDAAAFCGGIDINPNRLDDGDHSRKWAYHDAHAQLQGPVVQEFMKLYAERWNGHNDVIADPSKQLYPNLVVNSTDEDCFVQVTRTMPRGTHQTIPSGEQGTFNAVRRAVQRAERYIYIEEQYLMPYWGHVPYDPTMDLGLVQDLALALSRIKFLIIVIPNHLLTPQCYYRRHEFLEALKAVAGPDASKVHVYYLKRKKPGKEPAELADDDELAEQELMSQGLKAPSEGQDEYNRIQGGSGASGGRGYSKEIYVHSKLWIIDDVYVKCGSMNINRRGFTYDSEADFHAVDGAVVRGMRKTALAFRKALFAEHGRTAIDDVPDDVDDMLAWWLDRAATAGRLGDYDWSKDTGPDDLALRVWLDMEFQNVIDPDGR